MKGLGSCGEPITARLVGHLAGEIQLVESEWTAQRRERLLLGGKTVWSVADECSCSASNPTDLKCPPFLQRISFGLSDLDSGTYVTSGFCDQMSRFFQCRARFWGLSAKCIVPFFHSSKCSSPSFEIFTTEMYGANPTGQYKGNLLCSGVDSQTDCSNMD